MPKTLMAIVIGIFVTGFIAGIFSGASITSGEDVNPDSLIVKSLGIFCDSVKDVDVAYNTCRSSFIMISIFVFIIGIVEIVATASKLGNCIVGLLIYGLGWVIGLALVFITK